VALGWDGMERWLLLLLLHASQYVKGVPTHNGR